MARCFARFIVVAVLVVISACDDDLQTTGFTGPIVQGFGTISVFLSQEGDSPFGLKPYAIGIDSVTMLTVTPNSNAETSATSGRHVVNLKPPAEEIWCVGSGAYTQSVVVTQDQRISLEFHVRCPPLAGTGKFLITLEDFAATNCSFLGCQYSRRNGGERLTVTFQKITGDASVETVELPFWQETEIAVPAGVYEIKVSPSFNCAARPPTFADLLSRRPALGLTKTAAVHDSEASSLEFLLACN
jgi:hypothetical protein